MAKSKRRINLGTGGTLRPESPRRAFPQADAPAPPPQRPPAGAVTRTAVGPPRPLVPERAAKERGRWFATFGPQRLVVALGTLAVIATVGLLLYAWYDESIRPRRELALRVGDRSYNMEYWARRYGQIVEEQNAAETLRTGLFTTLADRTSKAIETEAIALQRAGTLGVTATANEIDREMLVQLGVTVVTNTPEGAAVGPDDPFEVTPAMEQNVRSQLRRFGLTLDQYRSIAEAQLLQRKIEAHFREQTPARAPQVRLRLLQFPNESDSRIAIQKITSGESRFDELADTVSLDPIGKGKGGMRDWLPRGILPKPVEDVAFSLPLETLSGPIDSGVENAWIVLQVMERSDERDVTDDARRQLARMATERWYDEQKESMTYRNEVTEAKARWAFTYVDPTVPEPTTGRSGQGSSLPGGLPAGLPAQPGTVPVPPVAPVAPPSQP